MATALAWVATPASAIDVSIFNLDSTAVVAFGDPGYGSVTLSGGQDVRGVVEELKRKEKIDGRKKRR